MTTKEDIREKTIELINDLPEWLPEKLDSLLRSGAIDFDSEPDTYTTPRLIMCALAREIEWQHRGCLRPNKKESARINQFAAMI